MAYILRFAVDGIAGRKGRYQQQLNRDVNVFFGANGSGKTSLLRILDSAMSGDTSILHRVPFRSAEVTIHSSKFNQPFTRSITRPDSISTDSESEPGLSAGWQLAFEEGSLEAREAFSWKTTPSEPDTSRTHWQHIYLPTWRAFHIGRQSLRPHWETRPRPASLVDIDREYDWDVTFAERLEQLWTRYSNELLAAVQEIQGEGLASILRSIIASPTPDRNIDEVDPGTAYELVVSFLERQGTANVLGSRQEFLSRYTEDSQLRFLVSDIDNIERRIQGATASRNRLEQLIREMYLQNKSVKLSNAGITVTTEDGKSIGLASLSSGEKQSLRIFLDALRAESSTLLIDEPEISLHVDWQRQLIAGLRELNPDMQLILATHSPEIMSEITDDKIFRI